MDDSWIITWGILMSKDQPSTGTQAQKRGRVGLNVFRRNVCAAKRILGLPPRSRLVTQLKTLSQDYGFSIESGELQMLNGSWYVTHVGLLRLARSKRCRGIHVDAVNSLSDSVA